VRADFPDSLREQVLSHDLTRSGVILCFQEELQKRMSADLQRASRRLEQEDAVLVCGDVAAEMIRLKTIAQCRDAHAEGNYYRDAEPYIQKQWDGVIWPIIKDLDFTEVLELAPGHGRNTEHLRRVAGSITPCAASMDSLPFAEGELDVIWSEGAIYNIGFARGIAEWRRFLKPGGLLVVYEITWTTASRPADLQRHWQTEYPEIDRASTKIGQLEQHGYVPIGYFVLPPRCWLDPYYRPLQARFDDFLRRHGHSEAARAIVSAEEHEIQLYEAHNAHFGYGMYVARRVG
jgi:SAM-dependent methyltransferase